MSNPGDKGEQADLKALQALEKAVGAALEQLADFRGRAGTAEARSAELGELLKRFIHIGRVEKISRLLATISPENIAMQKLCEGLGFSMQTNPETGMIEAELPLNP